MSSPGLTGLTGLPIRRLTLADLPACTELAVDRGWAPQEQTWRLLFAVSEVYGVDDPAGGLAATIVLTRYGADLAAIGMMLVASRHSRRGLGRRLMARMLDLAHGAAVFLFATDLGRPLYAQLGFTVVATSTRYVGLCTPDATLRSDLAARLVRPAGLSGLTAVDRAVFGADRSRVLAGLAAIADRVVECGDPVAGYAAAWPDGGIRIIGPVVADSVPMAAGLISSLADGCRGPVRVDISSGHPGLAAWAVQRGLQAGATNAVMAYGGALPGDRSRLFAPASVAIG